MDRRAFLGFSASLAAAGTLAPDAWGHGGCLLRRRKGQCSSQYTVQSSAAIPPAATAFVTVVQYLREQQAARAYQAQVAEAQRLFLEDLQRTIRDEFRRAKVGAALSHHANAVRQSQYYLNDRPNRRDSLHDAELWSGYAFQELEQVGIVAFLEWSIAAGFHMSLLQEWHQIYRNSGTQNNINLHYVYMCNHWNEMFRLYNGVFNYYSDARPLPAPIANYYWLYQGDDTVHLPGPEETAWYEWLGRTRRAIQDLRAIATV